MALCHARVVAARAQATACNGGWLREGALLHVVLLTDDGGGSATWLADMRRLKRGEARLVKVSGFVCENATRGDCSTYAAYHSVYKDVIKSVS